MLQALHVHNFALLEDARVEFLPGFNVFTGETGAGKSILIDAFGLVLGGRGSTEFIRHGAEGLWVQAVFDISGLQAVRAFLEEQGLEVEEELFLKRQLQSTGKGRAFVNGQQVPVSVLRELGALLVDIHGQHENQALLRAEMPRQLTDLYGGEAAAEALAEYKDLYADYIQAGKRLAALKQNGEQRELLLDRYAWECKEIKAAKLRPGEEQDLEEEAKVLQYSERIITRVQEAHSYLDADKGVLSLLAEAKEALRGAVRYDKHLEPVYEALESSWVNLEDGREELSSYLANTDFNGQRAVEVQERLDVIYRLQKKYGGSTESVLSYLEATEAKLEQLEHLADALAGAEKELCQATAKLEQAALKLRRVRGKAAQELGAAVTEHIHDLAMPNGRLELKLEPLGRFTPTGADAINFLFSANLGEPLALLEKVASGGELSRIALAIRTVLLQLNGIPTMVFDEIDTGVGGLTAQRMAEKLSLLATVGQVLCITHLPQLAAYADRHIFIEKQALEGRTRTVLQMLEEQGRVNELVRMGGGDVNSAAAQANARELMRRKA